MRREYYEANRGRVLAANRRYRQANHARVLDQERQYREDHREQRREAARSYNNANGAANSQRHRDVLRAAVFGHYGWSCACCGSTRRLTIDHVAGGGKRHRITVLGHPKAGEPFYRWLVKQGFPAGYQTLCLPCNASKADGMRCRLEHGLVMG